MAGVERRLAAADLCLGKSTSKPASRSNSSASAAASGTAGRRDTSRRAGRAPSARLYGPWQSPLSSEPRPPSRARRLPEARGRPRARRVQVARCPARPRAVRPTARPASSRPRPAITVPRRRGRPPARPCRDGLRSEGEPDEARQARRVRGGARETGADLDEAKERRAYAEGGPSRSSRTAPSRRSSTATRRSATRSSTSWASRRPPSSCPSATARCSRASAGRSEPVRHDARIGVVSSGRPGDGLVVAGRPPVESDLCDTIADGLAVRVAIPWPSSGCSRRPTPC